MKKLLLLIPFIVGLAHAYDGKVVTPLMLKELPDIPGKEALVITVDFAPGAADPIHRHDAHAFVYVLEGSIVMQLKGDQPVTLTPGKSSTRDRTTCTSSGEMRATRSPRRSSWCWSRTRESTPCLPD